MSEQRQRFLRRLRSEWAPTAWDLGMPVRIDTTLHFAGEQLWGWFKDIRPLRGECAGKEVLLYPQGFIQVVHKSFGSLSSYFPEEERFSGSANWYYAIPESLRSDVWSIWSRANVFNLTGLAGNNYPSEARFVNVRVFETAWQRSETEGSPPQLSESGIGWLVTLDGRLLELHASDATNAEMPKADAPPHAEEPALELPETMTSFRFEVHTKGVRRYHKQAILGAWLIACGLFGICSVPENASNVIRTVAVIPLVVGLYQFWCGKAGVRQGQLARAVSQGSFLENRVPWTGPITSGWAHRPLAPWFVRSLIKRGVSALLMLLLNIIAVLAVDAGGTLFATVLMTSFVCAVLDMIVFGVITNPSWEQWSTFEHAMLGNRRR